MTHFGEAEIVQLVEGTWSAVLGWEASPGEAVGGGCLTGSVPISGSWVGSVMLHCDERLARQVAAGMFGLAEEEAEPELVRDALGELTNIIGGNLKALFGGKCYLGLPTVTAGEGACVGRSLHRVPFVSRGLGLVVEVAERVA